jgi:hypothetical protein
MEEFRRYHKERNVLQIRIEIKTVTTYVMGIVVLLPPGNTYPSKAIPSKDLSEAIESRRGHYLVMPRVMSKPPTLNPKTPHQTPTSQMYQRAIREQNTVNTNSKKHCHGAKRKGCRVPLLFKQAHLGEL